MTQLNTKHKHPICTFKKLSALLLLFVLARPTHWPAALGTVVVADAHWGREVHASSSSGAAVVL